MTQSIVGRIETLSMPEWFGEEPASIESLSALEEEYGIRLPEDYRQLMLYSNGGGLYGHPSSIDLEPAETLMWHNRDEQFEEHIPGMFVIGSDGGGRIYFYDVGNQLGQGDCALFLVPLDVLQFDYAILVGRTITELMTSILEDEDFYARQTLGEIATPAAEASGHDRDPGTDKHTRPATGDRLTDRIS